eukprot:6540408-Prymnesium_polylepis.1
MGVGCEDATWTDRSIYRPTRGQGEEIGICPRANCFLLPPVRGLVPTYGSPRQHFQVLPGLWPMMRRVA